jgi:hypothetical protein
LPPPKLTQLFPLLPFSATNADSSCQVIENK